MRLDGQRSTMRLPATSERLRYLEEAGPVPELPRGRFVPAAKDFAGEWAGVAVCEFLDGELLALTGDRSAAADAICAYGREMGLDPHFMDLGQLESGWAVFVWEPEDAECPWLLERAEPGDEMAVQLHFLPQ